MNISRTGVAFIFSISLLFALASCNSSKPSAEPPSNSETKHYQLKGKIISIDKQASEANIDAEDIPGFMDAMVMPYKIKDAGVLDKLAPGDAVTGDLVVQGHDYWLENVKVTQASGQPVLKPTTELHFPVPGDSVPDFELVNQNGRRIHLKQYQGKTLLVTFIYTRCPFADYCPRVTHEFAQINDQLRADPALYGSTHLLSISFDPKHDTPKVLRTYALAFSGSKTSEIFQHWEFAASPSKELPAIAKFFGLTYQEDGGLITHSLSTAVIGPDGRIVKWYHGNDWQVPEVVKEVAGSLPSRPPSGA